MQNEHKRPVVLVTGAGRHVSIGTAIAESLAIAGWDVAHTYWGGYDDRMPWGRDATAAQELAARLVAHGARACTVEADLADVATPAAIFDAVEAELGPVSAIVLCHCESVDSGILDTTVASFDRHFAVNTRASWLMIKQFASRFKGDFGSGRIVALTSDHTVDNLPYGASKGALDRITLAAAKELAHLGITANVVNPGPVNTGWMTEELISHIVAETPLRRLGQPIDCANLIRFLCSPDGGWVNGQLIHSNGGL